MGDFQQYLDNALDRCCSTADLTKKHFTDRDIHYICFHYELDGKQYRDDLGETMSFADFYQAMKDGADTKTSQINADEFEEYWEPFLKEGKDILHVTLSSGISGVYNSANIAKDMLEERYPDRKIYVVDSLCAASGYGLLMDKIADLRDSGMPLDELNQWVLDNRLKLHHWVYSSDLTFYIKGGRISKTSGMIGQMLNICPMIEVDREGKLSVVQKIRTKRKAIDAIVKKMEEFAEDGLDYSGKCYVCHSACLKDAESIAAQVEKKFPKLNGPVEIYDIGTTIGSHTGPGTAAVFFWGAERK